MCVPLTPVGGGGVFHTPHATDHHATNTQHKKREFYVSNRKCSFDPADRQPSRQFFFQDSSLRERELTKIINEKEEFLLNYFHFDS